MNPADFRLISDAFDEAAALPPPERRRLLDARFKDRPDLLVEVEALLSEHDRVESPVATARGLDMVGTPQAQAVSTALRATRGTAGSDFARPGSSVDTPSSIWRVDGEPVPVLKGSYRLLRTIGEGGMGVVYEAEQSFPRRRVALKSIRPGLASRGMIRRFKTEIELLARLDHPGVAKIHEAGFEAGETADQAYFVMELVDGQPLHKYAKTAALGIRERVELLIRTCDAVQHAHQRGVIHRDLKPANIMVTAQGQPKILDFGVARASDDPGDGTMATRAGQVIGTPSYMSPEQMFGEQIDTRSDVYSLGVIAYELLTGSLPFDFSRMSITEAARLLRERTAASLSSIDRGLRGDLDVIVANAMHPDRERRYASADAMAQDLQRFLDNRPISARRDSAVYVLGKLARRHWVIVSMAMVLFVTLAALAVVASLMAARNARLAWDAQQAQRGAERASERSRALSQTLADELGFAKIERGRAEAAAGNLKLAESTLWDVYLSHPDSIFARWALWEAYHRLPCVRTVQGDADATFAAFPRTGQVLAQGCQSGVIVLRRLEDGEEIGRTAALGSPVTALAMSPDGDLLAFGLADGRAALMRPEPGATPEFLAASEGEPLHARGVSIASFSGDGSLLALGGIDRRVSLWDVRARQRTDVWEAHSEAIAWIAVSHDGAMIATTGRSVASGRSLWRRDDQGTWAAEAIPIREGDHISWMAFTREGRLNYAFSGDRINQLDPETMAATMAWPSLGARVHSGSESPDGAAMAFGAGQTLCIVPIGQVGVLRALGQQVSTIIAIGWSDAGTAVTASSRGELRWFNIKHEPAITRITGFLSWCFSAAWSPDGQMLALCAGGTAINSYRTGSLEPIASAAYGQTLRQRGLAFLQNSKSLVCGGLDGRLRIIDPRAGVIERVLGETRPEIYSLVIHPDQNTIVTGHGDGIIRVWDLAAGAVVRELPRQARRVEGLAFAPGGKLLASSGPAAAVQLWTTESWEPASAFETTGAPWGVVFTPDGERLLTSTSTGMLEAFDVRTGERKASIVAHQRLIPGLAISPDGAIIATGSEDGSLRLWDSQTLRQLIGFNLNAAELVHLDFDPSSRYLAVSAAWRQTIVIDLHAMDSAIEGNRAVQEATLKPNSTTSATTGGSR
jgi:WD40 repeat protein